MSVICTRVRKSLTEDHVLDWMTIDLFGNELVDEDVMPLFKSWLKGNHSLAVRVQQKATMYPIRINCLYGIYNKLLYFIVPC